MVSVSATHARLSSASEVGTAASCDAYFKSCTSTKTNNLLCHGGTDLVPLQINHAQLHIITLFRGTKNAWERKLHAAPATYASTAVRHSYDATAVLH
jgi:hypothetical protein